MSATGTERSAPVGDRFEHLVHYVCEIANTAKFGATKLNKTLWFVDTWAYRIWGESISGETAYIKRQFGPVPKNILKTQESLERKGIIEITEKRTLLGKTWRKYSVMKPSDPTIFSEDERSLINDVVNAICHGHTAASISELSHDAIWEMARIGEEIPIYTVLVSQPAEVTSEDRAWAEQAIKEESLEQESARV